MGVVRVLYVIDSLVPGGAERSLVSIAPHLLARDVALRVVTVHDRPGLREDLERSGVDVEHLAPGGRSDRVRQLAAVIRRERPELVHTTLFESDIAGRMAARRAGVPCVSTLASESYGRAQVRQPGYGHIRLRGAQAADIATAQLVRRFHAVSGVVAATMASRLLVPRRRIEVVHRGRDAAVLGRRTPERAAAVRSSFGIGSCAPLVVAIARHEYDKGLDVAVQAMAAVRRSAPEAILVVAGREGNQTNALRRLAREAGVEEAVRLLGPRSDVADLLAAADVFLAPSRREGLPGSVLEAMALEAPIVASDIPTVREAVGSDGSCARLVPVGSVAAVAAAMTATFASPTETAAKAVAGRARFERMFTIERAADGMVGFYERVIGG